MRPAARKAGVGWAGFHTLRHSCATNLFLGGCNAKQVQMWLGHHSAAFTRSTYIYLLQDDLPDAPPLVDGDQSVDHGDDAVPAEATEKAAVAAVS